MRKKLTRFFTITLLALVLGSATVAPVAAHDTEQTLDSATVVSTWQTTTLDTVAQTVTVTTMTYYSDGTWNQVVETWSYNE